MERVGKWKASWGEEWLVQRPRAEREIGRVVAAGARERQGAGVRPERCTVSSSQCGVGGAWVPGHRRFLKAVGSLSGLGQEMEEVGSAFGKGYSGVLVENGWK